ncbi:MAG: TonB-dependent receptor, partial [Xanthomonadales bacterium]|nr:TonB-dependent receptor [Xanthomonadales bacterium]
MLHRSIAAVLAASSAMAAAQSEPGADPASKPDGGAPESSASLDTITVTATKRSTPLQKTPIAITAIGAQTLEKERVITVQDITSLVPG